jgi:UDP-N-acetylglucosamine--N-acetylmuramyl-(pentapeptide) pyrophosphoryl-undecaprenol N-acetylglucosamine transferase
MKVIQHQAHHQTTKPNFFYICGLTGGPYFPIPAVIAKINENFENPNHILIGVRDSYEQQIATASKNHIEYLPKVKLDLLSFKKAKIHEIIIDILKLIMNIFGFMYSIGMCIFLLLKHRPMFIYSTGSFLAVPMIWSTFLLNKVRIINTVIIIHQQDATPGLANKLTAKFANLLSCTFPYTRDSFAQFKTAELIANPIIQSKYSKNNHWEDRHLESFVKTSSSKPLLLVFGGGSGALAINNWVWSVYKDLLDKFRVIHLTGSLQTQQNAQIRHDDYYCSQAVFYDMPTLLSSVDLVVCRAGMGSISELSFLNKPAFLVPIPDTHQEQNSVLISSSSSNFHVLNQNQTELWIGSLLNFKNVKNINKKDYSNTEYYKKLVELTKSS